MITAAMLRAERDLVSCVERALGERLPIEVSLKLAMAHGAALAGSCIRVVDPAPGGTSYDESLDYEALAKLVNRGGGPSMR